MTEHEVKVWEYRRQIEKERKARIILSIPNTITEYEEKTGFEFMYWFMFVDFAEITRGIINSNLDNFTSQVEKISYINNIIFHYKFNP